MSEEKKTPTEALKDLEEKAKPIIEFYNNIPTYFLKMNVQENIRVLQTHARSINHSILFALTWRKFFKGNSDLEPKFSEFFTHSNYVHKMIIKDLEFLNRIMEQLGRQKGKTAFIEYKNYLDNKDEYNNELDKNLVLFVEIRNIFIEEGEMPILPEAQVVEYIKLINPKDYDEWKDSG